jgi:hypothetical protein
MDLAQPSSIVLILADSNFINVCVDPNAYVGRLKDLLAKRADNAKVYTVSGRYGLSQVDQSIPIIQVDDRNKTIFSQTLENSAMIFDEMITVSIVPTDPFMTVAREVLTKVNKTITQYRYQRK